MERLQEIGDKIIRFLNRALPFPYQEILVILIIVAVVVYEIRKRRRYK